MPFFSKSVDKRSRNAMCHFLENHARHAIGNGYPSSYAHNVKIHNLRLGDLADKAYDLIQLDDTWWELQQTIDEFDKAMGYRYTIGSAGHSNGYLVLLESEKVPSGYKSHCRTCGQRNYKSIADVSMLSKTPQGLIALEVIKNGVFVPDEVYLDRDAVKQIDLSKSIKLMAIADAKRRYKDFTMSNRCGACGAQGDKGLVNYEKPHMTVNVFSYHSIDAERDFADWSLHGLRERVLTVEAFDRACDTIRDQFIYMLQSCEVVEETIMVPKTVKHLSCACNN
jgi:hypothetical protein